MTLPAEPQAETILIIDDDLGFLMWLGQTLAANGYVAVPAQSRREALRLIKKLPIAEIHLAIVNPALPGISDFINRWRDRRGPIKIIPIGDPLMRSPEARSQEEWLSAVRKALEAPSAAGSS